MPYGTPREEPALKALLFNLSYLLVFLFAGCGSEPVIESRPLLKVNDRQISTPEFAAAFARTLKPGQVLTATERQDLERAFLTQLIDRELTLAEARRRGLVVSPAELTAALDEQRRDYPAGDFDAVLRGRGLTGEEWQAELTESLLLDKLVEQVVGERGRVNDAEIDAYYVTHRADFDRPAQVRARQIMVADLDSGERALAELRRGARFDELAKRVSLSPEAEQGGDLGFFGRDEMPPEFDPVFDLPVGKLSSLVKSDYGYHLFLVEAKRPPAHLNRAEAGHEIRRLLEAERREDIYQKWLEELRGKASVTVDWSQLEEKR